jgi:hypothetical protein
MKGAGTVDPASAAWHPYATMTARLRVVLAEDSYLVREGVAATALVDRLEGVDIDLRPSIIGPAPRRSFRFSVGFAELDEVRMMDGLTAQGYMASMAQYDPSFSVRMESELLRFVTDQKFRPSLLPPLWGIGTQLLLRSSTLFYMVGNADQFGPAAVAAFEAWRAAHPALPTPTA